MNEQEILKAAKHCTTNGNVCTDCPIRDEPHLCTTIFAEYITKKEPAPEGTGTSTKDNILHFDDTTLLKVCQEGLNEIGKIAMDDYPNDFITGYIQAYRDFLDKLKNKEED